MAGMAGMGQLYRKAAGRRQHSAYCRERPGLIVKGATGGEDVELGGKLLRKGESVMVSMGAVNRDPAVFTDPDKLDLQRGPMAGYNVRNMTFGNAGLRTATRLLEPATMRRWECLVCGMIYEEAEGLPDDGIPSGTRWEDIPAGWVCPDCGTGKFDFELLE